MESIISMASVILFSFVILIGIPLSLIKPSALKFTNKSQAFKVMTALAVTSLISMGIFTPENINDTQPKPGVQQGIPISELSSTDVLSESIELEKEIRTEESTETVEIPYIMEERQSSLYKSGTKQIDRYGVNGLKKRTYVTTYENDREVKRQLQSEEIIKEPISQLVVLGTYVAPVENPQPTPLPTPPASPNPPSSTCHPNYTGACVPIDSDVDCASGNGNGPSYVSGPVYVVGTDIYGLDGDGNGVGCEN